MTIEELTIKKNNSQETYNKKLAVIEKHKAKKTKLLNKLNTLGICGDADRHAVKEKYGYDAYEILYDYQMFDETIRNAERNASDALNILNNWGVKLQGEIDKAEYIKKNCPMVIKMFLDNWEKITVEWYLKKYQSYLQFKIDVQKEEYEVAKRVFAEFGTKEELDKFNEALDADNSCRAFDLMHNYLTCRREMYKALHEFGKELRIRKFAGDIVLSMADFRDDDEEREKWLKRLIGNEKQNKMIALIQRVEKITGTITDASNLSIGEEGDINGFVIGGKGKALVQTISAGGWNIQCFHYRVLVDKIKQ